MNWYKRLTLISAAALAAALLLGACSDEGPLDDAIPASGGAISFGIVSGEGSPRAADASGAQSAAAPGMQPAAGLAVQPAGRFVLRSPGTADSLCVRTVVSDYPEPAAGTRAALVAADNFYTAFHVLAHWKANGTWVDSFFYMDVDVSKSGDVWGTAADDPYYWPGAQHTLKFYAYAPADAPFTSKPAKPSDGLRLGYTITPADADAQRDLVVAAPAETPGDHNSPQELTFNHICTAVRFVTGSDLQPGRFTRVELKGVRNSGAYDLESGGWTLDATKTGDFTQAFAEGSATTDGTTAAGTAITPAGEATFVMLPQELPEGATLTVYFQDDVTGTERSVSASIAGRVWPEGKQVTYLLSVQPGYTFELTERPTIDAHHTIHTTTLKVTGVAAGKAWTVTADNNVTIMEQDAMNGFAKLGFWTDRLIDESGADLGSARGEAAFSGTGSGEFPIALFIPENAGDLQRTIQLKIKFDDYTEEQVAVDPIDLTQLCPAWTSDGFGWEQIESDNPEAPWGFQWDRMVTYQKKNAWWNALIYAPMIKELVGQYNAGSYTTISRDGIYLWNPDSTPGVTITIDYSSLNSLSNVTFDKKDGRQNTANLYDFSGAASTGNLEQAIKDLASRGENGVFNVIEESGTNNMTSAVLGYILRKNKYNLRRIEKTDNNGNTVVSESAVIDEIVWYLPAVDQLRTAPAEAPQTPLTGPYWSSNPDGTANAFISDGSLGRMENCKFRACRNR